VAGAVATVAANESVRESRATCAVVLRACGDDAVVTRPRKCLRAASGAADLGADPVGGLAADLGADPVAGLAADLGAGLVAGLVVDLVAGLAADPHGFYPDSIPTATGC
jgi:hypothetical protein